MFIFINKCIQFVNRNVNNLLHFKDKSEFVFRKRTLNYGNKFSSDAVKGFIFNKWVIVSIPAIGLYVYSLQRKSFCEEVNVCKSQHRNVKDKQFEKAINESRELMQRFKDEMCIPGMVVGVSIDGKSVWEEGIGYADVENQVLCTAETVMRIASISKSITMAAVAKLWEEGKLDLDKPVQHYVPYFPRKTFNGESVSITCRHLVSHLGGIRHYDKSNNSNASDDNKMEKQAKSTSNDSKKAVKKIDEFSLKEYYNKERYEDIKSSLNFFKDDPLVCKPGSKFHYSTYGWTLISAIVESVTEESFAEYMKKLFKKFGMTRTYLDLNEPLIYRRSRNYAKDKRGHLINAPFVDNSYKWAGGGFLSTVSDLLRFGNIMLYSLQNRGDGFLSQNNANACLEKASPVEPRKGNESQKVCDVFKDKEKMPEKRVSGFLKPKTVETIWSPVIEIKNASMYAMGWMHTPERHDCGFCKYQPFAISHSGGAIGASSILLILPKKCSAPNTLKCQWLSPPKGIIITILTNLQEVKLTDLALEIAQLFEDKHSIHNHNSPVL